jgi:hypothetical protein
VVLSKKDPDEIRVRGGSFRDVLGTTLPLRFAAAVTHIHPSPPWRRFERVSTAFVETALLILINS